MISPEQLAEWERLSNESTKGPWLTYSQAKKVLNIHWNDWFSILAYNENGKPFILCSSNGAMTTDKAKEEARLKEGLPEPEGQTKCDMAFIAAAREAVPALIAEVRRLKKERTDAIAKAGTYEDFYKEAVRKLSCFDKEADWLAEKLAHKDICNMNYNTPLGCISDCSCKKCWRESARKATKEN